jgi:hypothetical protein
MTEPTSTSGGPYRLHHRRAPTEAAPFDERRDVELLEAVWENRFLTRALATALFPSYQPRTLAHIQGAAAAAPLTRLGTNLGRRLAALHQRGYLDRISSVRGGELVYALAQGGARLLRERQPQLLIPDIDWTERNRAVSPLFVDHALMIARLRLALTLATQAAPTVFLETFLPEARAPRRRWTYRGEDAYVNPDAFFILQETSHRPEPKRAAYFLEADRTTTSLRRLRLKYASYSGKLS